MMDFFEAELPPESFNAEIMANRFQIPMKEAVDLVKFNREQKVMLSDTHQVNIRKVLQDNNKWPMIHLSIKRLDKEPIHDWRVMQEIKNSVLGPEYEGVEIYPAESRLIDTANQYHMWCLPFPEAQFPFGFTDGRSVTGVEEARAIGATQREVPTQGKHLKK